MSDSETYAQRMRRIIGDPMKSTSGSAINPLFCMGLSVSSIPADLREEYERFLKNSENWRKVANDPRYLSGTSLLTSMFPQS